MAESVTGGAIPFAYTPALSEPEKLVAAYFASPTVGLGILDPQFRYVAVNNALAEINGLPAVEHLDRTIRDVLGSLADSIEPILRRVLSSGEPILNLEFSAQLPSRKEWGRWTTHFLPIKNSSDAVERIAAVVTEVPHKRSRSGEGLTSSDLHDPFKPPTEGLRFVWKGVKTSAGKLEQTVNELTGTLRRQMARLQMLLEISDVLASNWDVQDVFPRISARVRRVFLQEYASFALHDVTTGQPFREAIDFPLGKGFTRGVPISALDGPADRALQSRAPIIFTKEQLSEFDSEITRRILAEGLQTLCCVPLLRPRGPLGVFVLGSTRKNAFRQEDLSLLNQVAAQLAVAIENHLAAVEIQQLKARIEEERNFLQGDVRADGHFSDIIGESAALRQVLAQVGTVAASTATVLILGETGTGKELIARAIHKASRRSQQPFVKVNCAAIPAGLLESELFGHEKGSFTGAVTQNIGRMEVADGGTLFLDEVGDIPIELQPKLLRALQDQEFERLGSTRTIRVNVRVVAATNRDLARNMATGHFRADLFYRLNVFPVRVPPLRERREDIPLLVRYLVHKFSQRMDRLIESIPKETMTALSEWSWPGNVRELENLMERSVILSEGSVLRVPLSELWSDEPAAPPHDRTLDNAEREHILRVLHETKGVLSGPHGAAHRLGLKRTTLQSKMLRLKITRHDYPGPGR